MLAKIIKMEDIKDGFVNNNNEGHYQSDMLDIALFMQYTIELFKEIISKRSKVRQIKKNWWGKANEPYPNKKELERMNTYEGSD